APRCPARRGLHRRTRCSFGRSRSRRRCRPPRRRRPAGARAGGSRVSAGHWTYPLLSRQHRIGALDPRRGRMAWNLKGSYTETCSCDVICPCNASMSHPATYDYCRLTLVFNIREGDVEGTDIGGLKVAAIADTPKVMTEGNWKLGVFIDENATEE